MLPMVAFPALPEWLAIAADERPIALRPFGSELQDLAVEFDGIERARLVTTLLQRCSQTRGGTAPAEQVIWDLPLGTRIEAVVALAAGDAARPLCWRVHCGFADCGADGELQLRPAELSTLNAASYRQELIPVSIGGRTAWLRRPTGADQRRWLGGAGGDVARTTDTASIAASLFVDPGHEPLQAEGIRFEAIGCGVDAAMEEFDPLVDFRLAVVCADCGRPTLHAPDLLAAALQDLWLTQFELIDQVHCIASHYHWTEEEIARLPGWRRRAYLARIDGGGP